MNDPMDDRLGLHSASSFGIDVICHGRRNLIRSLPDLQDVDTEDAIRGRKIHKAWQSGSAMGLEVDEAEDYELGLKFIDEVVSNWKRDKYLESVEEMPREERLYLRNQIGEIICSGQLDRWYKSGNHVLVIDGKSGWSKNVPASEVSWQLRVYAVLAYNETGGQNVRVAYVKPKVKWEPTDCTDYGIQDLMASEQSIKLYIWLSNLPEAPRQAGTHCRYCKAAAGCPEVAAWQMLPSVQAKAQNGHITPKVAAELVSNISLPDCVKIWESSTARHNIEDACKARLKALSDTTLAELGLTFGKSKILHPITNVQSAFEFLLSLGVPAAKLWSVTKMSNGELATVVQEALGLPSKDAAEKWIRDKLGRCITPKPTERPLERI